MARISWRNKQREGSPSVPSLASLRGEMDRLLETFVREPFGLEWPFGQRSYAPTIDLAENNDEVMIRAEIPGIDPQELEVTVSGGQLVLAGEKRDISESSGQDFYHVESRFGRFRREIPLSQAVDPEGVEADYANGVLTIRLKKIPAAAPKRIDVKTQAGERATPASQPADMPPEHGGEG